MDCQCPQCRVVVCHSVCLGVCPSICGFLLCGCLCVSSGCLCSCCRECVCRSICDFTSVWASVGLSVFLNSCRFLPERLCFNCRVGVCQSICVLISDGCLSESFGTASANSVDSDLGCTSSVYFDNVTLTSHTVKLTAQKIFHYNYKFDCSETNGYNIPDDTI